MARQAAMKRRATSGVWYIRIFIPVDLQPHYGVEDKKISLRTTDEAKAKIAYNRERVKWDEIFYDLRSRRNLTSEDKAVAVWEHYESTLQRDDEKRKAMPSPADIAAEEEKVWRKIERNIISSDDFIGMINAHADLEIMIRARSDDANYRTRRLAALKREIVTRDFRLIMTDTDAFIAKHRLIVDKPSDEYGDLCVLMMRSEIQALERTIERDAGNYSGISTDSIVKPARHAVKEVAAPGETISELFEKYARENPNGVTADTLNQARRDVGTFIQYVGNNFPAHCINKKAAREWKDLLIRYPVKATETKVFAGMSIMQIVKHNETVGKPALTSRTVNRYLSSLAAFCHWLASHGYIDGNPIEGMSLPKDKRKKVFPFSSEQMDLLFHSPLFTGCQSADAPRFWNKAGNVQIRDHRFWVPLVMLYSGARPAEIAQLLLSDVRKDHGHWVMDITETEGDPEDIEGFKSLKTAGSRRVVPVHKKLIKLGFLDYYNSVKQAGHTRLFPLAERNSRGQMIADFSREFGRYLTRIGVKKGRGISLYSFRHGAFDAMRRAGFLDEQFNFIFGHVSGNKVTRGYGVLPQGVLEKRVELVNAISYPGLCLQHLANSKAIT
ncbi:site-specific integrase [Agrobacterium vitis]|uniref:Site-specific integrase n=1 Tax=Agrobacterium vitis TaxID=373 RepID=A0AAE2REP3_AGRVI|nr:site-specific integrase [Agrobacterium vitis]MBF2716878.1 site-specific integrase [Agrobacterium vitis]